MAEMGEEVRRRQNRMMHQQSYQQQFHSPNSAYYQQQQQSQHFNTQTSYANSPQSHNSPMHIQMSQNTQSMQNLNLNNQVAPSNHMFHQGNFYSNQTNTQTSPNYPKSPPVAPKPMRKIEEPPELPPVSTHPLYSPNQETPKMAFFPPQVGGKFAKDPWAREEQERQAEARREQARQWQEQQIRDLMALTHRTPQQEEQLRVLQLEREFQRRALEAAEQDDEDTEKVIIKFLIRKKYVNIRQELTT